MRCGCLISQYSISFIVSHLSEITNNKNVNSTTRSIRLKKTGEGEMLQVQQIKTWWMTSTTFYSFSLRNCLLIVGTEWAIAVCKGTMKRAILCLIFASYCWKIIDQFAGGEQWPTKNTHSVHWSKGVCLFDAFSPKKNPNHHGKKWWLGERWCSHQEFHSKTINDFQSYNPITVPQKKFDPTCHNRQQHCHLTIPGSQEKQINAKWKEGFSSYF